MSRRKLPQAHKLLASRRASLPSGWGAVLRAALLTWLMVWGYNPTLAPARSLLPLGNETNGPLESESPTESPESESMGEYFVHGGQRSERSVAGERPCRKLPFKDCTSRFSRGGGFWMAERCVCSESELRNGTGSHLRC